MRWIIENKEWLFSGIAVAIPIAFWGRILSSRSSQQFQRGGQNSTNIQVGGSVKIKENKDDK